MNIEILKANFDNVDTVKCIIYSCGKDMLEKYNLKHWSTPISKESVIDNIINKNVYLVKGNNEFIATFTIDNKPSSFFLDDKFDYVYLSKVAVLPKFSGQGIGKKCLEFCESYAISNGKKGMRLDVYHKSEHALEFYRRNNFVDKFIGKTRNFYVVCMEKNIIYGE